MKSIFLVLCSLCLVTMAGAQQVSLSQFKNWKPRNIGPAGMSGRITAIDAVVADPDIIYIGAASGGVWKTENSGQTWQPVFDDQPLQNIGSIAIQQSNPNVVWVGTGEGNPRNSLNLGAGIYRSLDAGKSWSLMGLEKTVCIHRIVIDPNNPSTLYVAATGNPYGEHSDRGVFKTTDGGATWQKILYVNDTTGCADLVMDPSNPNKLIASMWQFRRTPWNLKSGGEGSGLYITIDGGKNWKKLSNDDGLPEGQLGRIGIAFARSMPKRVYAKIEATKNGFYRSDDGGFTWNLINSNAGQVTDRPFYYQEIYVDPVNENRIYDVHSTITLSEDGGKSFTTLIPYSGIHPDHHAWWINPKDPNLIIEGNDGGIAFSRDRGENWVFDEKIPVGQFYHINVDNQQPYNVMGGMQDNGSWLGPAYTWTNGGIRNYYWNNVGDGDGFDVSPDPTDPTWIYSMSQGGYLNRVHYTTGEYWFIKPQPVDTTIKLRFNWNSAFAQDPFDASTIYYGSQFVHKSTDKGVSWQTISPDLTTNDSVKTDQSNTGGLTLDITGAETHCTILAIEPSTKDKNLVWVGTDDGNVQLTRDGGKTWTNFRGKIPGMPDGCWIPQIRASKHNVGEAFVVANDYRRGNFTPMIFHTSDYGTTWKNILAGGNIRGYALCVIQDPAEPNLVFAGTEHGLWISFDHGVHFEQWKNGYPSVSTYDLAIQEREADLAIATFGRSLWILDDIRPLRAIAASGGRLPNKSITAFAAPEAVQALYRPATGYEWSINGLWDAPNRPGNAAISFYIQPPASSTTTTTAAAATGTSKKGKTAPAKVAVADTTIGKDKKTVADSVQVQVFNAEGTLIRNLRWKVDTGFNRNYWGMEQKGVRQPGSKKPEPGDDEPGGRSVLPGVYRLVLMYGKEKDSLTLQVKDDPRIGNRNSVKLAQGQLLDRLQASADKLTTAIDRLNEANEVCDKLLAQVKGLEGKEADTLTKATKAIRETIKNLQESIKGKSSDKQGIVRPLSDITPLAQLRSARYYIIDKLVAPGAAEEQLVANAEQAIKQTLGYVNTFFSKDWSNYKAFTEGLTISLFKDYTPID